MWSKIIIGIFILTGLYCVFFRRSIVKQLLREQTKTLENEKIKQIQEKGFESNLSKNLNMGLLIFGII
jgi:hypothetical protein